MIPNENNCSFPNAEESNRETLSFRVLRTIDANERGRQEKRKKSERKESEPGARKIRDSKDRGFEKDAP